MFWKENYAMDRKSVLLKQASNKQELTNWENILIKKKKKNKQTNKDLIINFEILPADHLTGKFILNPIEGNRSVPTKKLKFTTVSYGLTMSLKALPIYSGK